MKKKQFIDVDMVKAIMKVRNIDIKTMTISIGVSEHEVEELLNGADQEQMSMERLYAIANSLGVPLALIIHKDYH